MLSDISLDVAPGPRLAIVGRSGTGKSSLVSGILRLLTRFRGVVTIDGIAVDTVSAEHLRQSVCFIPQNPMLFEGSLRFNLDFSIAAPDIVLKKILDEVFSNNSNAWTLERYIAAGGSNLSQGERQLVALTRALVTDVSIVIIDEATANLDEDTEFRVEWLLRKKFAGKNLIAIAHRLATIVDFDQVVVMDRGRVVEHGQPHKLIYEGNGEFSKLWHVLNHLTIYVGTLNPKHRARRE